MGDPASPAIDREKYIEVLQYLLREDSEGGANNFRLGKVKLMKLLYFADFEHFYKYGQSITKDTYIKKNYGPVPSHADSMIEELRRREALTVSLEPVWHYSKYSYRLAIGVAEADAEFPNLTPEELETLADVVQKWKNHNTQEIVLASHGDPPWLMSGFGEAIRYELVYYRDDVAPKGDDQEATQTKAVS